MSIIADEKIEMRLVGWKKEDCGENVGYGHEKKDEQQNIVE